MRILFGALAAAALIGTPIMASAQGHDGYGGDTRGSHEASATSHAPRQTGAYAGARRANMGANRGAYVNRGAYAGRGDQRYAGDQRYSGYRGDGYAYNGGYRGNGYGYPGWSGYGFDVDIAPYGYGYPGAYGYDTPYGYDGYDQAPYYGDDSASGPGGDYGDDDAGPPANPPAGYDGGYDQGGPPPQSGYDQGPPPQSGYDQGPPQSGYDQAGPPPNAGMSPGAPPADCGQWVWRGGEGRYVWAPAACGPGGYGGQ